MVHLLLGCSLNLKTWASGVLQHARRVRVTPLDQAMIQSLAAEMLLEAQSNSSSCILSQDVTCRSATWCVRAASGTLALSGTPRAEASKLVWKSRIRMISGSLKVCIVAARIVHHPAGLTVDRQLVALHYGSGLVTNCQTFTKGPYHVDKTGFGSSWR
jgi:hypothetical protein